MHVLGEAGGDEKRGEAGLDCGGWRDIVVVGYWASVLASLDGFLRRGG